MSKQFAAKSTTEVPVGDSANSSMPERNFVIPDPLDTLWHLKVFNCDKGIWDYGGIYTTCRKEWQRGIHKLDPRTNENFEVDEQMRNFNICIEQHLHKAETELIGDAKDKMLSDYGTIPEENKDVVMMLNSLNEGEYKDLYIAGINREAIGDDAMPEFTTFLRQEDGEDFMRRCTAGKSKFKQDRPVEFSYRNDSFKFCLAWTTQEESIEVGWLGKLQGQSAKSCGC
ncbi:hypothetical protein J1614_005175 [Plenodomus biglobosus]|nr:hypothetical protein J1614_005175 [Plenodomus biglobosus]